MAIVNFDKSFQQKNTFYIETKIKDVIRIRFYKSTLYLLTGNKMHVLTFPNGFNMPFVKEEKVFLREYNDFMINRIGVFVFIRGYSELIAAEGPNPEGLNIKKKSESFFHGRFKDSGFSTFIMSYTEKVGSSTKYFVSSINKSI